MGGNEGYAQKGKPSAFENLMTGEGEKQVMDAVLNAVLNGEQSFKLPSGKYVTISGMDLLKNFLENPQDPTVVQMFQVYLQKSLAQSFPDKSMKEIADMTGFFTGFGSDEFFDFLKENYPDKAQTLQSIGKRENFFYLVNSLLKESKGGSLFSAHANEANKLLQNPRFLQLLVKSYLDKYYPKSKKTH